MNAAPSQDAALPDKRHWPDDQLLNLRIAMKVDVMTSRNVQSMTGAGMLLSLFLSRLLWLLLWLQGKVEETAKMNVGVVAV